MVAGKAVRNCTIVGNRRIGKTSLLHEIEERLSAIYVPNQTIHFAKLYSSKLKSTWDAVYLTLNQLGIQLPTKWMKLGAIAPRYISRFPQLIHDFARQRHTYVAPHRRVRLSGHRLNNGSFCTCCARLPPKTTIANRIVGSAFDANPNAEQSALQLHP